MANKQLVTLRYGGRPWFAFLTLTHILYGVLILISPKGINDAAPSNAYHWVHNMLPAAGWGLVWITAGALFAKAAWKPKGWAPKLGLALSAWATFMWGLSIMLITSEQFPLAPLGALSWWSICFLNTTLLVYMGTGTETSGK